MISGARVGRPAPVALVASYFGAALLCWLAASVALVAAAEQLANEGLASQEVLFAVHLVGLAFLPLAVTGAALHVLPTLLRHDVTAWRGWAALPFLCAGPVLAFAIAHDLQTTTWIAAAAETTGFALVAWELVALVARAPRGRMLLASRFGVAASTFHAGTALVVGAVLADRGWRPLFGIPHDRLIAIHLHLAVIGWLTLLIVTVGRTLTPMLSLAPTEPRRRLPVEELVLTGGLWLLVAGLAFGWRALVATGALLVLGAVIAFAALSARIARRHRLDGLEGPLTHIVAGVFFLLQATILGLGMVLGLEPTPARLEGYVTALLLGWAAGVTLGHLGKLLSLSVWTWWPAGPRPKQAVLYPRAIWLAEAILFAVGVETLLNGVLRGAEALTLLAALILVGSALTACAAAVLTLRAGLPALRARAQAA
ncbi:MAG TPA: hypothetical protein VFG75_00800 [Gaiella sp.]|nr:hypothetical protein [Gaiella sp.]